MIFAADQVTKILVARFIPMRTAAWSLWGDFFRLIHVRNLGMAFGLGGNSPAALRIVMLIVVPILMLTAVGVYIARERNLPSIQRWALAAILGGGLGNQVDRIFRRDGVVDFLDFKFYGLFGLERWPTFNIADSSLVVSSIILFISVVLQGRTKSP